MPIPTQWNNIMPNFSGSAQSMNTTTDNFNQVGNVANQYLANVRQEAKDKQAQANADRQFSLQQAAEDRAKSEFDRQNKDRENRITFASVAADLVPHLQAQDTAVVSPEMSNVLQNVPNTAVQYSTPQGLAGGSVQVPVTQRVQSGTVGDPNAVNTAFKYGAAVPGQYKEGPMTSARMHAQNNTEAKIGALLNTPGMYTARPASSARDLNQAGLTEKAKLESQLKEVMRDKTIPKEQKVLTSDFNSLDLGTTYTKDGKVAGKDVPFGSLYVKDGKNGTLISMNTATAVAQKQQNGIDQASVPTYIAKTGYKDVPVSSAKVMQQFSGKGYSNDQVAKVASGVKQQYGELLSMLPKDNAGKREELRSYLNMVAGNLGIDPKDMDVNAYADKLLPKSEMSEQQKLGFQTILHGLDKDLEQVNKNREFSLQEWKAKTDVAFQNAKLGLDKQRLQLERETATAKDDPYTKAYLAAKGADKANEESAVKSAERQTAYNEKLLKAADDKQKRYKEYRESVGPMTDAYDYQQWEAANMPTFSERGWNPLGTWGGR